MAERFERLPATREGLMGALEGCAGVLEHVARHLAEPDPSPEALECCRAHVDDLIVAASTWGPTLDYLIQQRRARDN